ncbi:MAG: hypothetical protein ACE5L6_03790 [Candidatus Bathyarchaeia archaeon]
MLVVSSVFLPWAKAERGFRDWRPTIRYISGWEMATEDVRIKEITVYRSELPVITLFGGFLILIGAICGLARSKFSGVLILMGGIFAMVGAIPSIKVQRLIADAWGGYEFVNVSYGWMISLFGGILGAVIGPIGIMASVAPSRTIKEIFVPQSSIQELRNKVLRWLKDEKIKVVEEREDFIKGRLGTPGGLGLTGPKYFEISFKPTQNGVVVHTEGYVGIYGVSEQSLSPRAIMGAIPRRKGWKLIENLWNRLSAPTQKVCPSCGFENPSYAENFCIKCGSKLSTS